MERTFDPPSESSSEWKPEQEIAQLREKIAKLESVLNAENASQESPQSSPEVDSADPFRFMPGGGEMGALLRSVLWKDHPLGPPDQWPSVLKATLGMIYSSKQPMFLWWGKDLFQFYNDAYLQSFGKGRNPKIPGKPGMEYWPESWHVVWPQIKDVLDHGKPSWNLDRIVPVFRGGRTEDIYWTYSFTPVREEAGEVCGVLAVCTETTERVRAMQKLERSRQEFQSFFMQAPVPMVIFEGPQFVVKEANPQYERLIGKSIVGKSLAEAFPDGEADFAFPFLNSVFHTGIAFNAKEIFAQLPGEGGKKRDFWIDVACYAYRDTDFRIQGVFTIVRDVTETVLSRNQLKRSTDILDAIMSSSSDVIYLKDRDSRMIYCNPSTLKMLGMSEEEIHGKSDIEFLKAGGEAVLETDARIMRTGVGEVAEEEVTSLDGTTRVFMSRKEPYRDSSGEVVGLIGVSRDITEFKKNEERLTLKREMLETMFQQSPAAMALWKGPDFVFEKVNPKFQAIFPDQELVGKSFMEVCQNFKNQPFYLILNRVFETGEPFYGQEILARFAKCFGGPLSDHYFDFTCLRINDAKGNPYGVYNHAIDVTTHVLDRRALEKSKKELQESVQELEQEREIREKFVAALSHDLRTPLTAAKISAQILMRKPDDPTVLQKIAGRISENIERADHLIQDLLDASLIRAGGSLPLDITPCNLNEIASDVIDELRTLHGDRFTLEASREIQGYWSKSGVRRILENLCSNAVKYGDPKEAIRISLLLENEQLVRMKVHNKGVAIPLEDQAKLFEPYKRMDSAKLAGHKGWGLGLTLVKGIAEAHGGNVGLESAPETGTTFCVELPLDSRPHTK